MSVLVPRELLDRVTNDQITVIHMLRQAAALKPGATAVECDGVTLSYAELEKCVRGFADELLNAGGSGKIILMALDNSIELIVTTYAVLAVRAQLCPVNPRFTERELAEIVNDAEPAIIISSGSIADTLASLPQGDKVVRLDQKTDVWLRPWLGENSKNLEEENFPDIAAMALLQYTGGTTGLPKGVNLTHRQMATNIAQREACLPTETDDERILCVMPLYHVFATAMCLYLAVACRGALHILKAYSPEAVFDAVARHKITIFPAGPAVFNSLMAHQDFTNADFSSLHFCVSGSASLPLEILNKWDESVRKPVYEGYGQTEAGPVVSFNSPLFPVKPGSVGRPIPQTDVEIVDPQNGAACLPTGDIGEIRVRGPQLMTGYRNRPGETLEALRDGWLYTGDLGCLDEDGYLYIRGRKKEMIIVSGFNVYPREIDEVLISHRGVSEAATIGTPDARRGEAPHAFVVLNTDQAIGEKELLEYCRKNLTAYKIPLSIRLLDDMPRTSVGKIDIVALQEIALD
jgi:long-chain acyl-CoA synthetase